MDDVVRAHGRQGARAYHPRTAERGAYEELYRDYLDLARYFGEGTSTVMRRLRGSERREAEARPAWPKGGIVTSQHIQDPVRIGVSASAPSPRSTTSWSSARCRARVFQAFAARNASAIRAVADQYRVPDIYDGPAPRSRRRSDLQSSALHAEMAAAAARAGKHC
jgi:hypothetical protein